MKEGEMGETFTHMGEMRNA